MAEFQTFNLCYSKNRADVAQNLQGLSYEVCSANIATIFRTQITYSGFWNSAIIHQQLVATLREFMRLVYGLRRKR